VPGSSVCEVLLANRPALRALDAGAVASMRCVGLQAGHVLDIASGSGEPGLPARTQFISGIS